MKAVVWHGVGDIRIEDVDEPKIEHPNDAIVKITTSAICGTDLHMVRGAMAGMEPGTTLGHEAVGVVQDVGNNVRNIVPGDRVIVPSTIACGFCSYCREGYYSQCDNANPNGPAAGTCFFGGPRQTGPIQGLQAEKARIPYANIGLVKIPDSIVDDQAILLSDIFPTGWFGADMARIHTGKNVAVIGCGPVGQFAILSAFLMDAARVIAVDHIPSRLDQAREQGAEIINFEKDDPVEACLDLTGGVGVDAVIDAVGIDALLPEKGPVADKLASRKDEFQKQVQAVAPEGAADNWNTASAPSLVLEWAVQMVDKAGTISVIGVYPPQMKFFPFGMAMNKNLRINAGNCHHRKYIPDLLHIVQSGMVQPEKILSQSRPFDQILDAYKTFDTRAPGWLKVEVLV